MPDRSASVSFAATVRQVGINPCVDPPRRVSAAFGRRGYVPVKGRLEGKPFRATLVPLGAGRHRLFLNGIMRMAAGVDVGDRVTVVLLADTASRTEPMNPALAAALARNAKARTAFAALTPSRRKEILRYLNHLKGADALRRNVARVVAHLGGGRAKGPAFARA